MNLRRKLLAFLKSQKKNAEYTELEWIGNEERNYISVPLITKALDIIEIEQEVQYTDVSFNQAEIKNGNPYFFMGIDTNLNWYAGVGGYGSSTVKADTNWHTIKLVSYGDNRGLWLDGERIFKGSESTGNFLPYGFDLWKCQGNTGWRAVNRKKYVKVKVNGKLVCNLIPVLDKDFTPCMYDKVTGKFFYNQGDSEFKWKLPNQLEYLESDGNQWIDTGLFGNQDTEIQTQFEIPKPSQRVYGYYKTNKNITAYESTDGGNHRFGNKTALIKAPLNKPITIIHNKNGITYDGTLYGYENVNDFETDSTLYVGSINGFSSGTQLIGKLYYFKILQNGKFVQYLIPAFDENLNICMYDLVSKTYLYNQGSGTFKGFFEDGSQLVSYLESTGTQYIDTGLTVTPTIGFYGEGEASLTDASFETMAGYDTYFLPLAVVPSSKRICMGYGDNTNAPTLYPLTDGRLIPSTETSGVSANLFIKYSGRFKVSLNFKGSNLWQFEDKNIKFEIGLPAVSPEDKEHTMTVFGRKYDNNITNRFMWRGPIYRAIFTDGEQVIMNLVPVVKSDNTACMLDLISKQYFVNAGSGSFSYG